MASDAPRERRGPILVPIDFSRASELAVAWAARCRWGVWHHSGAQAGDCSANMTWHPIQSGHTARSTPKARPRATLSDVLNPPRR